LKLEYISYKYIKHMSFEWSDITEFSNKLAETSIMYPGCWLWTYTSPTTREQLIGNNCLIIALQYNLALKFKLFSKHNYSILLISPEN
jgi:hypothetical protein